MYDENDRKQIERHILWKHNLVDIQDYPFPYLIASLLALPECDTAIDNTLLYAAESPPGLPLLNACRHRTGEPLDKYHDVFTLNTLGPGLIVYSTHGNGRIFLMVWFVL
jgi:hypothetical protein